MNVSTKSRARSFHGTGWVYLRNDKLDAKNFFTNLNGQPKPPLRFNVYGYNIGGPFFVPKLYPLSKSKTFFFFNEEWRKLRQQADPSEWSSPPFEVALIDKPVSAPSSSVVAR